jgi:hypothetical protein
MHDINAGVCGTAFLGLKLRYPTVGAGLPRDKKHSGFIAA